MVDDRLYQAAQAGQQAATLGDMPQENLLKSILGSAYNAVTLPRDVYDAKVDPLSDEGVERAFEAASTFGTGGLGRAAIRAPIAEVELGTFAGSRAPNAPIKALHDAFEMKLDKVAPDRIWKDAGWMELPDKNWMWEISDDLMRLNPNPGNIPRHLFDMRYPDNTGVAMSHPQFAQAYPDMARTIVTRKGTSGGGSRAPYAAYPQGKVTIPKEPQPGPDSSFVERMGGPRVPKGWDAVEPTPSMYTDPSSVLLHELQHQIQAREGWVPGSSRRITEQRMIDALNREIAAGRGREIQPLMGATLSNINTQPMRDMIYRLYQRDLGEMMSRATQYRQNLSPYQRRMQPPWLDFDYGIENAIIPRD